MKALVLLLAFITSDIPVELLAIITKTKAVKVDPLPPVKEKPKTPSSKEINYSQTVKRGARPPQRWDIEGDDFANKQKTIAHIYEDHRNQIPHTVDGRILDLSPLSLTDLRNIHSMAHDGRTLGKWLPTVCPLDGSPCEMTWEWYLP